MLKQAPWPTREHRTYTPRAPKHRVIEDRHVVPSFLGEHSEVGPKLWEEMVEKIFECVRERPLTEEMRDLVFGTPASTLVVGVVDGDGEEPKRKGHSKAQRQMHRRQPLMQGVGRSVAVATNERL